MTREDLIEAILEVKLTPEQKKARRKKWAKRAAIGAGVVGAGAAAAYYGPKVHHAYGQRKIRNRVYDNIAKSQRARRSHGYNAEERNWYDPIHWTGDAQDQAFTQSQVEKGRTQRKVAQWAHDRMMWGSGPEEYERVKDTREKLPPFAKSLLRHVEKHPGKYKRKGVQNARGEHAVVVQRIVPVRVRRGGLLRRKKLNVRRVIK